MKPISLRRAWLLILVFQISSCGVIERLASSPVDAPIPTESTERYENIPHGTTPEDFPRLGDPSAPVKIVELSSYDCSSCARFHADVFVNLVDRIRSGEVVYTYIPLFGTGRFPNGEAAARAAVCAGEQDNFWSYHDALFTWQALYENQAFTSDRLRTGAANLGLNLSQWDACLASESTSNLLIAARDWAISIEDFVGTPTVLVNGTVATPVFDTIVSAINTALADKQ